MFTPIVRHWRRGDLDRLYVTTASGRQLGWFDLVDETLYTATESLRPLLWRAVTDFRLARRPELPAAKDLASHEAGVWELERAFRCVDESPLFYFASTVCKERDERGEWQTAAAGATAIAETVATIPGGWVALHSVPSGRYAERLDHVLVGPAGVVVVLSEHVSGGEVTVGGEVVQIDGVKQKIIAHLGKVADHVGTRSPDGMPVHVVLAVHGATVVHRKPLADERVQVVAAGDLAAAVGSLPEVLDGPTQDALFALLRRRSTWYPHGKHGSSRLADPSFALAGLQLLDGLPRLSDPAAIRQPAVTRQPVPVGAAAASAAPARESAAPTRTAAAAAVEVATSTDGVTLTDAAISTDEVTATDRVAATDEGTATAPPAPAATDAEPAPAATAKPAAAPARTPAVVRVPARRRRFGGPVTRPTAA